MPHLSPAAVACLLAITCAAGCGDDDFPRDDATDATDTGGPDATDASDTGGPDATDATDATDGGDTSDADTDASEPVQCAPDAACDAVLLPDGRCPGACFPVDVPLTCRGEVAYGACRPRGFLPRPNEAVVDFGDFTVTAVSVPTTMTVGDTAPFEVRVHNDTDATLTIPLSTRAPGTWDIADASWDGLDALTIAPGGDFALTATLTAVSPTTLSDVLSPIASFSFGDDAFFEPRGIVGFALGDDTVSCGGHTFPKTYCSGDDCFQSRFFYNQARCCGDVFFPSAACCVSADCPTGACVDGVCVREVPTFGTATGPPLGNHRILLVLVDTHPEYAGDVCADHADPLADDLSLDLVEELYDAYADARLGRSTLDIRWTVRAGLASGDLLDAEEPALFDNVQRALAETFDGAGCEPFEAFDEVVVSMPGVELGDFGGRYMGGGFIAMKTATSPYLFAHELGHAFGGDDLYLELGGSFQWRDDLMGNSLTAPPLPADGVLWGQMGFADVDDDGVIDIARYATAPDALSVDALTARITAKGALEIELEVAALQDGDARRLHLPFVHLTVPAAAYDTELFDPRQRKLLTFDDTQVDLDALRAAGTVEIGVRVVHRFTDADWQPRELVLDETRAVTIEIE